MNDNQRLQLQNMIKTNNIEDQTELIRSLKHSQIIKNEIFSCIFSNIDSISIFYFKISKFIF
jgi:arginine repressor